MQTHAANPVAESLDQDHIRIYFNCRDQYSQSHIAWLVIDLNKPQSILELSKKPALSPAEPGTFDDSGVSIGCLTKIANKTALYNVGWNIGKTTHWRNSIGLAYLENTSTTGDMIFQRYAHGPIMDRDPFDPYNLSYPWVIKDSGQYRMWYGSNLIATPADLLNVPHVFKHASSKNGIQWSRDHRICIGGDLIGDCAFTKPCVIKDSDCYRMWYCHRGSIYQIGYEESEDGLNWRRMDDRVGISPSETGWDEESLSYPCVFDHSGDRFMLYNGKRYGATGFGLAILES